VTPCTSASKRRAAWPAGGSSKRFSVWRRRESKAAPGTHFRNFHASVHLRKLRTRRVAFPAYAIAYRYRHRLYRTVISGQDPACVIGDAPRSLGKILVIGLTIAATAAAAIGFLFWLL
jgi:hypothetical protein